MTVGANAPVDPLDRYAQTIAAMERRIAELERAAQRGATPLMYLNAAARDAAIPLPKARMMALLTAGGTLTIHNGTTWVTI